MTDDEKREFEEFLKWKAERNKECLKLEKDSHENHNSSEQIQPNNRISTSEQPQEESKGDVNFKLLAFGGGLIFIIFIIILLSHSFQKQNEIQLKQEQAYDSIRNERNKIIELKTAKEKAVKDSIAKVKRINTLRHTVKITTAHLSSPNSAGGCDATVYYKNLSNKTIKYFYWEGFCKNTVGDRVACEIRGYETYRGKDTGPVRPRRSSGGTWDCIIYNYSARKLIITNVEIVYMDGSSINISQNEMKYIK